MATAYQKIRQRKLIYLALIIGLLIAAYFHRTLVIEPAAQKNELSEANLGKIDLGGSISRFVLSSFRGPLVCGLWWDALEQQRQHNYARLEMLIKALTLLQPHYKGPWKYQAWNLAYNVSVEFDRPEDKYEYITKGLRWLANGEAKNRITRFDENGNQERTVGDPDMRQDFAQHLAIKMYQSDEQAIFRPFLHMSCIPASKRDPQRLRNNPDQLKAFKAQYPRFVSRVKEYKNVADGDEPALNQALLTFLSDYQNLPCLWKSDGGVVADDPWPRYPDNFKDFVRVQTINEALDRVADQEIYQDGLEIARYWYEFSTESLPPPNTDLTSDITPKEDRFHLRNKHMHSMIFRSNPARAKCNSADELGKEGWAQEAQDAWKEGHRLWLDLAQRCNMEVPAQRLEELFKKAQWYAEQYSHLEATGQPPPDYLKEQSPKEYAQALDGYKAAKFLNNYRNLRQFSHYDHWRDTSETCQTDLFREASRSKYLASRRPTDWPVAIEHYQRAIALYTLVMRKPMNHQEQLGLRLSLLTPGTGPLLAQIAPPVSIQLQGFAKDEQNIPDLLELQEDYMRVMARQRAPERLRAESMVWALRQALSMSTLSAAAPGAAPPPGMIIPLNTLNIDWIEDILETEHGPFDDFIEPGEKMKFMTRDKTKKKN
jgi:hypothetical protein